MTLVERKSGVVKYEEVPAVHLSVNNSISSSPEAELERHRAQLQAKLEEVARRTGFSRETVAWIHYLVISNSSASPPPEAGSRQGLSAEELCEKLIRHANETCPGELLGVLVGNGIQRSEDIGEIVTALIDEDVLRREEDDFLTDFDGLFETEHLGVYLAQRGIRRRWVDWPGMHRRLILLFFAGAIVALIAGHFGLPPMARDRISGACVAFGGILLFVPPGWRSVFRA